MKKILILFACLIVSVVAFSQTKPNFEEGTTFQSNMNETLDFYNDGTVVYHAKNAPVSRRGEWVVDLRGKSRQLGNVTENVPITVTVFVSGRRVEMRGYINYHVGIGNNIKSLTLNGSAWRKW